MIPPELQRIRDAIPVEVVDACKSLRQAGYEAWLVGGAIRDLLLGGTASDFDIATSAHPPEVTRVFGRKRTVPTGEKHGTVTVLLRDARGESHPVEVTTFRGEGAYSDGRRPDSVEFVSDLVEDLRRRDFTVNAIAFDPIDAVLADPFGGRADLDARLLRAVGDARERFGEDGLRAMRAVRLAAKLGFALDPATEAAIPGTLDVFRRVSAERVRDELLKLLAAPRPSVGLRLMQKTGLLAEVIPELCASVGQVQNRYHAYDVWEHTLVAVDETPPCDSIAPTGERPASEPPQSPQPPDPIVRLGTLLHDVAKPRTAAPKEDAPGENTFFAHDTVGAEMAEAIGRRLRLSNKDRERVVALVRHHMFWYSAEWTGATVRRFIGKVGVELLPALFALREGDVHGRGRGESPGSELDELRRRIAAELEAERALKITDLAIGGADVMRILGCGPGRVIGDVLKRLLERVIEEPSLNTAAELAAMVPEAARAAGHEGLVPSTKENELK